MDEGDLVSVGHGYRAMFRFLEAYFERTKADEVAVLLGNMNLADDGRPMDPAMWHDWVMAVQETMLSEPVSGRAVPCSGLRTFGSSDSSGRGSGALA